MMVLSSTSNGENDSDSKATVNNADEKLTSRFKKFIFRFNQLRRAKSAAVKKLPDPVHVVDYGCLPTVKRFNPIMHGRKNENLIKNISKMIFVIMAFIFIMGIVLSPYIKNFVIYYFTNKWKEGNFFEGLIDVILTSFFVILAYCPLKLHVFVARKLVDFFSWLFE
ncbi:hypothetical protein [Bartonella sp. CB60]|uniref:hypothetical protein n=1 Tax=Bartonella sp. CB60 TaxID=3113619 RepID=UPI00300E3B4A